MPASHTKDACDAEDVLDGVREHPNGERRCGARIVIGEDAGADSH